MRLFLFFFFSVCTSLAWCQVDSSIIDACDQSINEEKLTSIFSDYEEGFHFSAENKLFVYVQKGESGNVDIHTIPLWVSIFPPLIAIFLALVFREVHVALLAGIWFGASILSGFDLMAFFTGLFRVADTYFLQAVIPVSDDGSPQYGHISIIVFSLLIGGMVSVISANGGMHGIVERVSTLATTKKRAAFTTWLMGLIIFFDDYANTLVVGNTMRPLTDKHSISREKLAYIVDSTAAPIAAIALVTTWIGFQLTEIERAIQAQTFVNISANSYELFLGSLKYAYYPIFTIFFVLLIVVTGKDFGPMYRAEKERKELKSATSKESTKGKKGKWWLAAVPVCTLVLSVIAGLFVSGWSAEAWQQQASIFSKIQVIIGNADSYQALLWGSMLSCLVAVLLSVASRSLSIEKSIQALIEGLKTMLSAVVILVLAWSLAQVIEELHTADFLVHLIPDTTIGAWLPLIVFIVAAVIAFATGSSWGTMAILYPIVIPLALSMAGSMDYMPVLLNIISVVLAASVFGDHCSPISDTTIMSSMASDCNHISHVRTQLPYALVVGSVSVFVGGVLFALGVPWWINYVVGFGLLFAIVHFIGKKT